MECTNQKNALNLTRLDNGIQVVTCQVPYIASATIAVWVRAGSIYETEVTHGVNHFVEHLVFAGTPLYSTKSQLAQAIESTGGILNAFGEREGTCYWVRSLAEYFPTAIHVLGEMLSHPLFRAEDIGSERLAILQELKKHRDAPASWVYALMSETLWPKHAYGRYVGGSEATGSQLGRQEIVDYYRQRYHSHNVVIAVVGNISHEQVNRQVEKSFDDLPNGIPSPIPGQFAPQGLAWNSPHYSLQTRDSQQLHICLGARISGRQHPSRYAFEMLNVILGRGMSSKLFNQIRTRSGFAYSVHTTVSTFQHTGAFTIYTGTSPDKGVAATEAIFRELEAFAREKMTEEMLARAKNFYKARVCLSAENAKNHACLLGENLLLDNQVRGIPDILADVDRVTVDSVNMIIDDYLKRDNFRVAAIGPLSAIDELTAYLQG